MTEEHEEVWSSDDELEDENLTNEDLDESEEDQELHQSVSSDGDEAEPNNGAEAGEENSLIEDGYEMAIHGGGTLEDVAGFDEIFALTEGFPAEDVLVEKDLATLPYCCSGSEADIRESVCGRDDRVRITKTTRIPWRWNCQLIITLKDGRRSRCTGWFIGPRTVMTAGHCVYSHGAGGWAKQIEVIPGLNSRFRPYGSQTSSSFRSVRGWTKKSKPEYDYGCIILPNKSLGNRVGWFGFAALSSRSLRRLLINNAGYAGDKPFGTLWFNAGRITKVKKRRLEYMIDTYGGHSGSPTWRLSRGKRHAVGIHAYGGCPNKSTRITKSVFNNMRRWKRS